MQASSHLHHVKKIGIKKFHRKIPSRQGLPLNSSKNLFILVAVATHGDEAAAHSVFVEGVLFPWQEVPRLGKKRTQRTVTTTLNHRLR
jgi:hypothetical protein